MLLTRRRAIEFRRVDGVVLDRVAGAQHLGVFEAGDGAHDLPLHFHRQRGGHAVDVDLVRVEALGLEEELVLFLVRELDDLVFDRRAVARADGLDLPGVHGRARDVFADEAQRFRRGVGDVAGDLALRDLVGAEAERCGVGVAGLLGEALQSMVRPSRRGGVPVFRRQPRRPRRLRLSPSRTDGGSPLRPAGYCCSPQWMRPFRNVPVVMIDCAGLAGCGHRAA